MALQCRKDGQKEFVTISQRLVLIDKGGDFLLEGFKRCRLSIIGRDRSLGSNSLGRGRGIFFHPGVITRGGGFRAAGLNGGARGFPPLSLCPFVYYTSERRLEGLY